MADLSVIITAHGEGLMAGPTVQSAEAAIAAAKSRGITIERLIALDRPTSQTEAFFRQPALADWTLTIRDFGDPFLSRNAAAQDAQGTYLAFVDGDDMISENWLWRGVERLKALPPEAPFTAVHPELNWLFDGTNSVFRKRDQHDDLFLPEYMYFDNYYDMMCICPRDMVLAHPYAPRDISKGFGFQDWQWNLETMAAGMEHVVEPDTVIFKRRRENSISELNRQKRGVVKFVPEAMAIDRVRGLGKS